MGTPQTPEPATGTGVQTTDANAAALAEQRRSQSAEAFATLPVADRVEIMRRRQANIVTAQIASTNWGKGMDPNTAKAISDWGERHGIDVTKEINVLGGNIYLNAEFYLNRLATLIERGRVLDWRQRFVNEDPRLRDDVPAEVQEKAERRQLRIAHNIPEGATSAVVTELWLTSMPHTAIVGVKWAPRHESDPIGAKFPQESALTRSARRCLKQAIRYLPEVARYVQGAEEDAETTVSAVIEADRDRRREIEANNTKALPAAPIRPVSVPEHVEASPVTVHAPGSLATSAMADAYSGETAAPKAAPATPAPAAASDDDFDEMSLLDPDERALVEARQRGAQQ